MIPQPPKKALAFLRWFCREDYLEEIEGDITEIFQKTYESSPSKAKRNFYRSVFRYFRPAFMKSFKSSSINPIDMFRHNFTISLRNFRRNKSSFLVNLFGLSTGLACSMLIWLWVSDEKAVNHWNEKDDRIYQVLQTSSDASGSYTGTGTQGPLAGALAREIPEVEHAVTIIPPEWFSNKGVASFENEVVKARTQFVSKDYFRIFTCPVIQGDARTPLPDLNSVVITKEFAIRLFHSVDNVIGKTINLNLSRFSGAYHITAMVDELPPNVTSRFDLLFNFDQFIDKRDGMQYWTNSDPETFVLLREGSSVDEFNTKLFDFAKKKDAKVESNESVQRFSDRYLWGNYENGKPASGRIFYVQLMVIIGLFILVVACINFMNLTTARATRRIKEVGVKKSLGASRSALIFQYFCESSLITMISMIAAIGIVFLFLPRFNTITGKDLALILSGDLLTGILAVWFVTSLLAGSYPALYLSKFNAATVLKGKLNTTFGELFTRQGLVVFQFAVSVVLMMSVYIVYQQMDFIQNKNLGYKKDNIVVVEMEGTPIEKLTSFHSELKQLPGIRSAGSFYHNLSGDHGSIELNWDGKTEDQQTDFANLEVGYDFIETMGIEFAEGHSFTQSEKSQYEIILNESAIRFMGIKDPIGKEIRFWGQKRQIVGVTKDFNFESLHEKVKPAFFQAYPAMFNYVIRIEAGREHEAMAAIEQLQKKFAPGLPFEYRFLDESYQALYVSEQRVSVLSRYFAGVAIIISCLGLFALASFTAEKRTKEIGIRKVLGSGEFSIVYLLSKDFTRIVLISILIAMPVSYIIASNWLDTFAFHVDLHWYQFAAVATLTLVVAWLTIGGNTIRAARANPVECLKTE